MDAAFITVILIGMLGVIGSIIVVIREGHPTIFIASIVLAVSVALLTKSCAYDKNKIHMSNICMNGSIVMIEPFSFFIIFSDKNARFF